MTFEPLYPALSRRQLLRGALAASSALCLPFFAQMGAQADDPPLKTAIKPGSVRMANLYAPFRMGIQSYSLRHFNTDDMLAKTRELGLSLCLEAFPSHFPMTDGRRKSLDGYKDKLKAASMSNWPHTASWISARTRPTPAKNLSLAKQWALKR